MSRMAPQFYSLGMLVTGRIHDTESSTVTAMDLLAEAIADEERGHDPLINFLFTGEKREQVPA